MIDKLPPPEEFAAELIKKFTPAVAIKVADSMVGEPFHEWVRNIIVDGRSFTYKHHEYLIEPYKDDHPDQSELKGTQLGLTIKALLRSVYGARYGGYRGILYLFPSKSDVTDFSRGRVSPLIDDNPDTIGKWLSDTDQANIKRIWNAFLYLRGMRSRVSLKSIPVDFIIFDELDEAPQNAIDMALERMAHSEFGHILKLSNPTLPDYGVDKAFQETDQRFWFLKCEKCGHYTDIVGNFPTEPNKEVPVLRERKDGSVYRVCLKCEGELNPSVGEWVAKHPSVTDKRGRQYSQLFSHYVDPKDILYQYRTTDNLTDFYNLKIGLAYVEATNRLTIQDILALCHGYSVVLEDTGPCFMGVDQGKDLHVVIGKKGNPKDRIPHLGVYKDWEDLDPLMKKFNVLRCVVDALPETRNARAFANRFPGKVYLNYYNEHRKGNYAWNEKELIVQCNRTESLDSSHREIADGRVELPRQCEVVEEFAKHLHNVAKKLEEIERTDKNTGQKEKTGEKRYVYVRLGVDHFRHAYNYEVMARHNSPNLLFPDYA